MASRGANTGGFGFGAGRPRPIPRQAHPHDEETETLSVHSLEPQERQDERPPRESRPLRSQRKIHPTQHGTPAKGASSFASKIPVKALLIGGAILLGLSAVIVIPTVLTVILTRNPRVTDTTTTTTVAPTARSAYWGFDNDATELYGVYNGALTNGATFSNVTYFGYGFNLALNSTANQSVIVASPFFNLSYTSFTVEAWVYMRTVAGDNAVFSQCQCLSCQDQCLNLLIRNGRMYMGFTLDDVVGSIVLAINTWYHVAYVYDYSSQTQSVYVQGVLDQSQSSAGPYLGVNGSIVIGSSQLSTSSFNGFIDNLKLTTRAKSSSEVLASASIVAYYSFDGSTLGQDMGPNQMNGTISNGASASGRVGQALALTGSVSSYFQLYGFYQLGISNQPFSFSMWLFPGSINGGILIHKSTFQLGAGGWCYAMMGLTSLGQIVMIVYTGNVPLIVGPILSVRTWTHLGFTYSLTNGLRMYINGTLFGTTGPISWSSSGLIDWLNVGSWVGSYCAPGVLTAVPYLGSIDEFYIYRRELNASEVTALANP